MYLHVHCGGGGVLLGRAETLFVAGYWIAGFGSGIKLRKWIDNSAV